MKIFLCIIFICILSFTSLHSQLSLSPNVGFNISSLSGIESSQSFISCNAGVSALYNFSSFWGLESGIYITQKGANNIKGTINISEYPINADLVSMDLKTTYMKIPLMLSIGHSLYKDLSIRLKSGPYFSYGLLGKGSIGRLDNTYKAGLRPFESISFETSSYGRKVFPGMNRWDIGCSFNIELVMYDLQIGVLYDLGISKLSDFFPIRSADDLKNRTWSVYIAYKLPFR